LVVLDVGHGSAAVLRDEGGVVVFDTGRGANIDRHLKSIGVRKVEALFLSHADLDHIGGAITLLLNKKIRVGSVFLNPDATKNTDVFLQLRYALCEAMERKDTTIEPSLTTSTNISRKGASIEVLYPPATVALGGVGGRSLRGNRLTSNSLSAAIRVSGALDSAVLLGGDIEFACLDEWKRTGVSPASRVLVFPHHGGLPGKVDETETALFAHELAKLVMPEFVVFSIHRSKFGLPRDEILTALRNASKKVRFACTQLPERLIASLRKDAAWSLHVPKKGTAHLEGTVEIEFRNGGLRLRFC